MADQSPFENEPSNLEECFRNYKEKKVTKENVWSNHFINDFQRLTVMHHKQLGTFALVGSMLEASSQIYGLKVDWIYSDVLRLSSGILRENKPTVGFSDQSSIRSVTDRSIMSIRRRLVKATIVGNGQVINAELQRIEEPDCLIKLTGSNEVNTRHLLQNCLTSDNYALSLQMNNQFWVDQVAPVNELDDADSAVVSNGDCVELPALNWIAARTDVVRPKVTGYVISNTPCDDLRYPSTITVDNDLNQLEFEENEMDFQFDVSANVSPIELQPFMRPDIINESLHLTEDDRNSLRRCTVLQQKTVAPDDLRPLTASPLEYSYRRITNGQISTGPNHWKLPSVQLTGSGGNKKRRRRKIAKKDKPVLLRNVLRETINEKFISVDDPSARAIRQVCYAKWNPNKLKRPTAMNYSLMRSFAPGIVACLEALKANADKNTADKENDGDVVSNMEIDSSSTGDNSSVEGIPHFDQEIEIANPNEVMHMDVDVNDDVDYDVGYYPPKQVPPVQPQHMQISPANVNVKEITKRCLEIICGYEAEGGEATFSYIVHKFRTGNVQVTPALVFSSLLQLANENNFHLKKIGENDFVIQRI